MDEPFYYLKIKSKHYDFVVSAGTVKLIRICLFGLKRGSRCAYREF